MSTSSSQPDLRKVLETYLGPAAGSAVADGTLPRGQTFTRTAAILLADLRGSTTLLQSMSIDAYADMLNSAFDAMVPEIISRDGEVLQFTGDGLLAVFDETDEACRGGFICPIAVANAFDAASAADESLRAGDNNCAVGFGLSYGEVAYGNVGTDARMTFTVISAEVSRADRLQRLCPLNGQHIAMSDVFASALKTDLVETAGAHPLKGFGNETEVFIPCID